MTMITPSYLGETIEYSSLHACRSTLEDPTRLDARFAVHPLFEAPRGDPGGKIACGAAIRCATSHPDVCVAMEARDGHAIWSRFDLATGARRDVVHTCGDDRHAWDLSPDGETLAFSEPQSDALSFVSLSTHELRQVEITPSARIFSVAYAPDGQHLLLTAMADSPGPFELLTSKLDGHATVLASTENASLGDPSFSPDGRRIAVTESRFEGRLWLLERRPRSSRK